MTKPMGFYGADYNNAAIASFSKQFEKQTGECSLSDNDQAALVSVLAVHAWGLKSGLEQDFWQNADSAIGDGVETSAEADDGDDVPSSFDEETAQYFSPMRRALEALSDVTDEAQCYSIIAWLVQ